MDTFSPRAGVALLNLGSRLTTTGHFNVSTKDSNMRYICLVYFDPQKVFGGSAEANAALADSGAYNEQLRASGHLQAMQALVLPNEAVTVRVRDGKMSSVDGPFMETKEVLGGFIDIKARDQGGHRDRGRCSACEAWLRRSAAHRGLQQTSPGAMTPGDARHALETAYRTGRRRVLATLIRLLGGFEPAEGAVHVAFAAAAEQ